MQTPRLIPERELSDAFSHAAAFAGMSFGQGDTATLMCASGITAANDKMVRYRALRPEIFVARQAAHKLSEQIGGAIDVVEGNQFDGAVHVAIRNCDEARGDAA